LLITSDKKP